MRLDEISDLMYSNPNSPTQRMFKSTTMKKNVCVPKIVEQGIIPNSESKEEKKGSKSPMISIAVPLRKKITNEKRRSYVEANYNMNGMSKFFSPVPA